MSYTIGSFNVLRMDYISTAESKKNLRRFAEIIRGEKFDVVALQEVISEGALKLLVQHLNPQYWDSVFMPSKITASKDAQKEGYAFLWKKKRLHLVGAPSAVQMQDRYQIKRDSSGDFRHQGKLIRPPLVVRLTPQGLPGGSNFEIRLINTHIVFSSPAHIGDRYEDDVIRKMELKVLAEKVYRSVADRRYGINLPAYTILMGDYNLVLCGKSKYTIPEEMNIDAKRRLRTVQQEKTTLKHPPTSNSDPASNSEDDAEVASLHEIDFYSRNYDHFSYEVTLDDVMKLTASRVEALGKYYGNDLAAYRREISDHVPIKLVMQLSKRRQ